MYCMHVTVLWSPSRRHFLSLLWLRWQWLTDGTDNYGWPGSSRAAADKPVSTAYRMEPILPMNDVNSVKAISNHNITTWFKLLSLIQRLFSDEIMFFWHNILSHDVNIFGVFYFRIPVNSVCLPMMYLFSCVVYIAASRRQMVWCALLVCKNATKVFLHLKSFSSVLARYSKQ